MVTRCLAALTRTVALFFSGAVQAVPVQWTLDYSNTNFDVRANGSFVYDADLGIYSDANISYSDTVQGVVSLTSARQVNAAVGRLDFVSSTVADLTGVFAGGFSSASLAPALTNRGGTITDEFYFGVVECLNSSCTGTSGVGQQLPFTGPLVGTPVSAAIPLPASVLSLLGGTGVARRRTA